MDFLPENRLLERKPDQLEMVRKECNLEKPGRMKEAVKILHEWVQKQSHFRKKDFSPFYLETALVGCKGSIERAKSQLDKICTMRTVLPQFFGTYNVKTDFGNLYDIACAIVLPKPTDDYCRIYVVKLYYGTCTSLDITNFFRYCIINSEYMKVHDYVCGFRVVIDLSETNLIELLTTLNPVELRQAMSIYIEGYGLRVKSINIISSSKIIDTFVSLFKQVLNPKISSRIYVHKTVDELHTVISKDILPKDFGGEEKCLKKLQAEWIDALSSEEHINAIREMNAAATDESCRSRDIFTEQYAGMPGTFRLLSVD